MAIHLYIDTNIYLNFYHYSNDDLKELEKISKFINNNLLKLYIPEQTIDEFYRNRENKLMDALKKFQTEKLSNEFPQFCRDFQEYGNLRDISKQYENEKKKLLKKIKKLIGDDNLPADILIKDIFSRAIVITRSGEIIQKAKNRFDIGNPPGKNGSYGDAINWESLLFSIGEKTDLHIIAKDKDYISALDPKKINPFLSKEWDKINGGNIMFYQKISDFSKDKSLHIRLQNEIEKENIINEMESSSSFSETRRILKKISKLDGFTNDQINNYVQYAIGNRQIYWISQDSDINSYLHEFVSKNSEGIRDDLFLEFYSKVPLLDEDISVEDLPF